VGDDLRRQAVAVVRRFVLELYGRRHDEVTAIVVRRADGETRRER
jgi:hypothetical protein